MSRLGFDFLFVLLVFCSFLQSSGGMHITNNKAHFGTFLSYFNVIVGYSNGRLVCFIV